MAHPLHGLHRNALAILQPGEKAAHGVQHRTNRVLPARALQDRA